MSKLMRPPCVRQRWRANILRAVLVQSEPCSCRNRAGSCRQVYPAVRPTSLCRMGCSDALQNRRCQSWVLPFDLDWRAIELLAAPVAMLVEHRGEGISLVPIVKSADEIHPALVVVRPPNDVDAGFRWVNAHSELRADLRQQLSRFVIALGQVPSVTAVAWTALYRLEVLLEQEDHALLLCDSQSVLGLGHRFLPDGYVLWMRPEWR